MFLIIVLSALIGGGIGYGIGSPKHETVEYHKFKITKACYRTAHQNRWLPENTPEYVKDNIETACKMNIHDEFDLD